MAANRGTRGVIARSWRASFSVGLPVVLLCGVLLLSQLGCQQGAKSPESQAAVQQAPENASEPAPVPAATSSPTPVQADTSVTQGAATTQPETVTAQPAAGKAQIEIEKPMQDFGNIGPDTVHSTKFVFKNTGTAPLKIVRFKACCGSTTRGVKPGQEYAPGESGALEVDYHAGAYPGPLQRTLSLETNDPDHQFVNLTIKVNVVLAVEYNPKRLNLYMRKENAGCKDITLKSIDGKPFSITSFKSTANSVISAEFDPTVKATEFTLKLKADRDKLQRNPKGQVSIATTHPECSDVRISYDVVPEFTISPPQIMLFNLKPNEPIQREIWVLNNYRDDFEIESVTSQKQAIKLIESKKVPAPAVGKADAEDSEGPNGTRYQLRVEITAPPTEEKRAVFSDVLEVKVKNGETLLIQCRGFYAAN